MTAPPSDNVKISPHVLCQVVGDEMVIMDLKSESYFGLDATGTRIWQLIEQNGNISEVHRQMLEEFDVDEGTLGKDLPEHLDKLVAAGLITRTGSTG